MAETKGQYAIAVGDPWSGMQLVGPFDDANDANDFAQQHYQDDTWWVMDLQSPEDAEEEEKTAREDYEIEDLLKGEPDKDGFQKHWDEIGGDW